jgi:hypothetical protein
MRTHGFGLTAALCCALMALSACPAMEGGQTGDEGSDRTQSSSGTVDGDVFPYCHRNVYGPEGQRQAGTCRTTDERYLAGELRWTPEQPTPAGPYECSCDDVRADTEERVEISDALDCDDAMTRSCGPDTTPQSCGINNAGSSAQCWAIPDSVGSWQCRCSADQSYFPVTAQDCVSAVFSSCPTTCASPVGQCESLSSGPGYSCTCSDGSTPNWPGVLDCSDALDAGCIPKCEDSRGSCSWRLDGYQCSCAPAGASEPTAQFVSHDRDYGNCGLALDLGCGVLPAGESCGACTADGRGGWSCNCPDPCPSLEPNTTPAMVGALPGQDKIPAPPADLLNQPHSCNEAYKLLCGCQ